MTPIETPFRSVRQLCGLISPRLTEWGFLLITQRHAVFQLISRSMHEAFACFSSPPVTYKPIEAIQQEELSISQALAFAFDDAVSFRLYTA